MTQLDKTFMDFFKQNKGVYSHNDVEKIVRKEVEAERERIGVLLKVAFELQEREGTVYQGFAKDIVNLINLDTTTEETEPIDGECLVCGKQICDHDEEVRYSKD